MPRTDKLLDKQIIGQLSSVVKRYEKESFEFKKDPSVYYTPLTLNDIDTIKAVIKAYKEKDDNV